MSSSSSWPAWCPLCFQVYMNPPNFEPNSPISLLGSSLLVPDNEGRTLLAFGHAVVVPLDGKQTGGSLRSFSI